MILQDPEHVPSDPVSEQLFEPFGLRLLSPSLLKLIDIQSLVDCGTLFWRMSVWRC